MEQLEKLTPEQKKLYESLMAYDSVMTNWLDAQEENRIQFKSNPIKAFLDVKAAQGQRLQRAALCAQSNVRGSSGGL